MAKKKKSNNGGGKRERWETLHMASKLEAVTGWAKEGYIDIEIAKKLGVGETTFYKWKKERPEFEAALLKGKEIANGELVNAAFRNATGYYVTVTEPIKRKVLVNVGTEDRPYYKEEETIEMVTYDKYIPANSTMGIFMLKNRIPDSYRDKQEIKHDGQVGVTFIDDIPAEDDLE